MEKVWASSLVCFEDGRLCVLIRAAPWIYSNEAIRHPFMLEKEIKDIPVVPPVLAL